MSKFLAAIHLDDPSSLKRFIVGGASALLVLLAPLLAKWGLPMPSDIQLETFAAIVSVFLLQSGANAIAQANAAGKAAAASIDTLVKADAVLSNAAKPTPPDRP